MKSGLNKVLAVIAKIIEIGHWISIPFAILLSVLSLISNPFITAIAESNAALNINCYGFIVNNLANAGSSYGIIYAVIFLGCGLICAFIALIFRNLYTVFRTIDGKNKNTESSSPFQKVVVDSIKKIGILSIAIPIAGFVISSVITVVALVCGSSISVSLSLSSVIVGLICLSLSQIFTYGAKLEDEVDGLL